MKKILAIVLALTMLLGASSALADVDVLRQQLIDAAQRIADLDGEMQHIHDQLSQWAASAADAKDRQV